MANDFPLYIRAEYLKDGKAEAEFLADTQGFLSGPRREFARFAQETQDTLRRAISLPRNSVGSLDLGTGQLQEAKRVQDALAISAREYANALSRVAAAEGFRGQATRDALAAAKEEARVQEGLSASIRERIRLEDAVQAELAQTKSATDQVIQSQIRGTSADRNVINSRGAVRQAGIQAGQQLQDMVVQFESGTRATTIFAQQVPQLAFALSGLEGKAGSVTARLGAFARFLAGPWGAAVFIATTLLGPFIAKLFETEDAANRVKTALEDAMEAFNASLPQQSSLARVLTEATRERVTALAEVARLNREVATLERAALIPGASAQGVEAIQQRLGAARDAAIAAQERADAAQRTANNAINDQRLSNRLARERRERDDSTRPAAGGGLGGGSVGSSSGPGGVREAQAASREWERAGEQIQQINERFNEQPRLIDQAVQATRQLDDIIAGLSEREPVGFAQMITDAREAQAVIQDALVRPFAELEQSSQRRMAVDQLILGGREDEAAALQEIWNQEKTLGPLTEARKDEIIGIVQAERAATDELQRQQELQNAYLSATKSIRGELESLFSGEGFDIRSIARRLQAQISVEAIFGDALREIDDTVRSGFDNQVDYLTTHTQRAQEAIADLATAASDGATALRNPGAQSDVAKALGMSKAANDNTKGGVIIVPHARPDRDTAGGMTPQAYFDMVGRRLVEPLVTQLNAALGVTIGGQLSDALGGAVGGYLGAGPVGGALGLLANIPGLSKDLSKTFGSAFEGAGQGAQIAGLLQTLGLGGSKTGGAIGGAAGQVVGGPIGQIIGSVVGSTLVGALKSTQYGTASFNGGNSFSVSAKGEGRADGATELGNSFQTALNSIADTLDASIGSFAVSIGTYKDEIRVSDSGKSGKLKKNSADVTTFADEAEAQAYALANAIADGAIKGLSAAEERLFKANKDIQAALQDVLDFRSVFTRLKAIKDPVGAALDELNDEFEGLIDLFNKAGASAGELAQLEELYGIERARAIKSASDQIAGSLKSLLDDLNIGDNGLSLRERQANATPEYEALRARVQAGDTTAFDDFASAGKALLDIKREIFGSQEGYFTFFDELRSVSQGALSDQQNLIDAATGRDNPFSASGSANSNAPLIAAIDGQTSQIVSQMVAMNDNMATLIQLQVANGVGGDAYAYAGFGKSYF